MLLGTMGFCLLVSCDQHLEGICFFDGFFIAHCVVFVSMLGGSVTYRDIMDSFVMIDVCNSEWKTVCHFIFFGIFVRL